MGLMELPERVEVVNIGLERFEAAVRDQGAPAVGVDWRIPAGGDPEAVAALARLLGPASDRVDAANAEVIDRLDRGVPMLLGVETASAVVHGLESGTILHCGPPIGWAEMCDPLRRSIRSAAVAEGWVRDRDAAERMLDAGEIRLEAANEHSTVVPMASAIGPSAPVYVVSVEAGGTTAYASLNQGSGAVPWFGVDSEEAIERLRFLRDALGPALAQALDRAGPIDVFSLAAQGVAMGDDVHMRVQATTNLLLRDLLPHLVRAGTGRIGEVADFLSTNHLMFLNIAMAGARALTAWAGQVPDSSIVTTMAPQRNHLRHPSGRRLRDVAPRGIAPGAGRPVLPRPGTGHQRARHRRQCRAGAGGPRRSRRGQLSRSGRLPRWPHGRRRPPSPRP